MERFDIAVIGGGPAGAAVAIRAARQGARVVVVEKGAYGRDKICGDGLTPRAVAALNELEIPLDDAHRIAGLRMIAGNREWTRSIGVCRALVRNPKTPLREALLLLEKLPMGDIRALAKSDHVKTPIQRAARKKVVQ